MVTINNVRSVQRKMWKYVPKSVLLTWESEPVPRKLCCLIHFSVWLHPVSRNRPRPDFPEATAPGSYNSHRIELQRIVRIISLNSWNKDGTRHTETLLADYAKACERIKRCSGQNLAFARSAIASNLHCLFWRLKSPGVWFSIAAGFCRGSLPPCSGWFTNRD